MAKEQTGEHKLGNIEERPLVEEMQESYIDYAMSVIVSRALPDVRDGLKPVQRRILYSMWQMGLKSSAKFRKSATVVGEVMGKYHPHGDAAIYDTMVRLAQDFSMRQPLVRGQGNFGSMDGDGAAAMRYTEAKLEAISEEMLADIEKQTVVFAPNYDGTQREPRVLPSKVPNLLLNGTSGIAVGMATSIPPHNLGELVDATVKLIDSPETSIEELTKIVPGPDFPTGATIYNKKEIAKAYGTGKGSISVRGNAEIEEQKNGSFQIIITEIPYQVNKASLIEKIANLVRDKKIEGIRDLRDESSKGDVRIVIELKKDSYPKKVLNAIYKHTELQQAFHMNMLALVDSVQPRVLNLKSVLEEFIKHREEVVRKRAEFDLERARDRAHILEGLKTAVDNIDAVVKLIKNSKDKEEARLALMKKFKLSERQSAAILEMRLHQLANLERLKIETELKDKRKLIKELEDLLKSRKKILGVIKEELSFIKEKFATPRRTKIVAGAIGEFSQEDLIPKEPTFVVLTRDGYVKRLAPDSIRTQGRGGKGVGLATKEDDVVLELLATDTHADLLFFTSRGRVFQLKAYEVPPATRTAKGQAVVNFLQLAPNESVTAILPFTKEARAGVKYLVMGTKLGMTKKVSADQFEAVRRNGLIALRLKTGDSLEWVQPSSGSDEVMYITKLGQSVRIKEAGIRAMGRTASGVRAMKLKKDDEVVHMGVVASGKAAKNLELMTVTELGYGKRSSLTQFKVQGRGGSGIKAHDVTTKTGQVVGAAITSPEEGAESDIIVVSTGGQIIRLKYSSISLLGRVTQGVRLMKMKAEPDKVASLTVVV
jgi:DNA gyrase subunit A